MSQERGDSSNGSDEVLRGPHCSEPPPAEAEAGGRSEHRGFTVQAGGRHTIAETAERIGRAAGTAERQMRRSLELVRPAGGGSGHSHALAKEPDKMAAHTVGDEAANPFGGLGELTGVQRLREQLQDGVARSRMAARRLVSEHPAQTLAAVAGFCVALGVGLSVSGSRR